MSRFKCKECDGDMKLENIGVMVAKVTDSGEVVEIISADKFICKECSFENVYNFGSQPVSTNKEECERIMNNCLKEYLFIMKI